MGLSGHLAVALTLLLSRGQCDGKGPANCANCVRFADPDARRRCLSPLPLLHADRTETRLRREAPGLPAQHARPRWGDGPGGVVPDEPRPRTDRDDPASSAHWRLPVSDRPAALSQSHDRAALLASGSTDRAAEAAPAARSGSGPDDGAAIPAIAADLRCRLDRPRPLRQAREGDDRLQPDQARAAVGSPPALFRGTEQELLAWRVAAR